VCIEIAGRLFTGDTLMTAGPGRHGAFEGARETLADSLARLARSLSPETLIHPGHDDGPTPAAPLSQIRVGPLGGQSS
jgi:glyoxylase-like metal-dependent hydrolase (beta-lactamase superfamily II)